MCAMCTVITEYLINLQSLTKLKLHLNPDQITFKRKRQALLIKLDKPWRQNDQTAHQMAFHD